MTAEQATLLKKELKNWQEIREIKRSIVLNLVGMVLANGKDGRNKTNYRLKNAIVDNLVIEKDAEYRIKMIKVRLGIR